MQRHIPQNYFSRLWRAIVEFDLIQAGDRILVGLSGGKDSLFLTYALAVVRDYSPQPFELGAVNLDPQFTADFDPAPLVRFCDELAIPFFPVQADIAGAIAKNQGKDPCFICSYLRRAVINNLAVKHGYNKVALAHHHDDAVETFVMSLIYSGQLTTFLPRTHLDRTGLTVIRPLVYFRERELRTTPRLHGYTPLPSPCPRDGKTKRQEVKELIAQWRKADKYVFAHLVAAMREGAVTELWPAPLSRAAMKAKHDAFWLK